MDLTISRPALHEHADRHRVLWLAHDGALYWSAERCDSWDEHVLDPEELLALAPKDGTEATIRLEILPINAVSDHAASIWLDAGVDLVGMSSQRGCRAYGRLERGGFRRRLDTPRAQGGMAAPTADGRWIVWETEDDRPIILEDWTAVVLAVGV